jgi:hypothetical protein
VLCADSLPEAMAYAVDLRTIRDRCLFTEADDLAGTAGGTPCADLAESQQWCHRIGDADLCNRSYKTNATDGAHVRCVWNADSCTAAGNVRDHDTVCV